MLNQGFDMYLLVKYNTYFGPSNLRNFFVLLVPLKEYLQSRRRATRLGPATRD